MWSPQATEFNLSSSLVSCKLFSKNITFLSPNSLLTIVVLSLIICDSSWEVKLIGSKLSSFLILLSSVAPFSLSLSFSFSLSLSLSFSFSSFFAIICLSFGIRFIWFWISLSWFFVSCSSSFSFMLFTVELLIGIMNEPGFIAEFFAGTILIEGDGLVTTTDLTTTSWPIELLPGGPVDPVWEVPPLVATLETRSLTGDDEFKGEPDVLGDNGEAGETVEEELINSTNLLVADLTVIPPLADGIVNSLIGTPFWEIVLVKVLSDGFVFKWVFTTWFGLLRVGLKVIKVRRPPLSNDGFKLEKTVVVVAVPTWEGTEVVITSFKGCFVLSSFETFGTLLKADNLGASDRVLSIQFKIEDSVLHLFSFIFWLAFSTSDSLTCSSDLFSSKFSILSTGLSFDSSFTVSSDLESFFSISFDNSSSSFLRTDFSMLVSCEAETSTCIFSPSLWTQSDGDDWSQSFFKSGSLFSSSVASVVSVILLGSFSDELNPSDELDEFKMVSNKIDFGIIETFLFSFSLDVLSDECSDSAFPESGWIFNKEELSL